MSSSSFPIVLRENFSSSLNLFDPGPMPLCEKLKTADAKPSPANLRPKYGNGPQSLWAVNP